MARAARVHTGKGIDAITLEDQPIAEPGPGEALVRLKAATLNYRDLLVVNRTIPGIGREPDVVPLSCGAGEVVAVGAGVIRVKPGDRVVPIFAQSWLTGTEHSNDMLGGAIDGVARQYGMFSADGLTRTPDELGDLEAATLPCAALTSWSALTGFRPTEPGEWVLAHGTGGVSIAALQLAKAMGAKVAITSSSDAKLARARSLGADLAINYRTSPDWAAKVRAALGEQPIANVIDTVGGTQFGDNAALLVPGGQISAIGMLGSQFSWGEEGGTVNIARIGVGNREQHEAMTAFIAKHGIRPVVDVVYDLEQIADAYRHLVSGQFFGKVAISLL
jgi:NADPH:quinone reductase-like Zn-dependent oxidoreductase